LEECEAHGWWNNYAKFLSTAVTAGIVPVTDEMRATVYRGLKGCEIRGLWGTYAELLFAAVKSGLLSIHHDPHLMEALSSLPSEDAFIYSAAATLLREGVDLSVLSEISSVYEKLKDTVFTRDEDLSSEEQQKLDKDRIDILITLLERRGFSPQAILEHPLFVDPIIADEDL
jgi:hypothetical protein